MRPPRFDRPHAVTVIASFQCLKGAFLLIVAALLWLAPYALPRSATFSKLLVIAAHGRDLPGILIPVFGCYLIYIGVGLLMLRPGVRTNLAISSAITIALSLQRLGLFGESDITNILDRQTLYILILLDFAVYIYLAYHPGITRSFNHQKRFPQVHS